MKIRRRIARRRRIEDIKFTLCLLVSTFVIFGIPFLVWLALG